MKFSQLHRAALSIGGLCVLTLLCGCGKDANPAHSAASSASAAASGAEPRSTGDSRNGTASAQDPRSVSAAAAWAIKCQTARSKSACAVSKGIVTAQGASARSALFLTPNAEGGANLTLLLPLSLDIAAGATLQIDALPASAALGLRTCVPDGCLVSLSLSKEALDGWRKAQALAIETQQDNGQALRLRIDLSGLSQAIDQAVSRSLF